MQYDYIILGAGIYGLYAAVKLGARGRVLVIDAEQEPFLRGSYVNQARVHNGYHYPRSYATASKLAGYYRRFMRDFGECIKSDFTKIYAMSSAFSWTNGKQFQIFCDNLDLRCEEIPKERHFNPWTVDKAFITEESAFDAHMIRNKLYGQAIQTCDFKFGCFIDDIKNDGKYYSLHLEDGSKFKSNFVLNVTYAGVNQIHTLLGLPLLPIKYELCEVILCQVSDKLKDIGITVMDGPFFSIMPFGKRDYHSMTTVSRTPHNTSYDPLPTFPCQGRGNHCTPIRTQNCNTCPSKPTTAFIDMLWTAKKYLNDSSDISFKETLFTLKPILQTSEIDDSRPTLVRQYSENPHFYTVFSGKINTMYDMDLIL
ncbi:MAG: FAD-dependent oxidoreductase [Desulfovibrionaceae bacterium]|nr:FAD-dependent oxidoreductase [Desulfovibrionaceae bacterium]